MGNCYPSPIDRSESEEIQHLESMQLTSELRKTLKNISFKRRNSNYKTKEDILGEYILKKKIGRGLFSDVYLAINNKGK